MGLGQLDSGNTSKLPKYGQAGTCFSLKVTQLQVAYFPYSGLR